MNYASSTNHLRQLRPLPLCINSHGYGIRVVSVNRAKEGRVREQTMMMNPAASFDFASSSSSSSSTTAAMTASSSAKNPNRLIDPTESADHLQHLVQMTQGVGSIKAEEAAMNTDPNLYAQYHQYYSAWPQWPGYHPQLRQPGMLEALSSWPTATAPWPPYASSSSKKGRQTYHRYQTQCLEAKFSVSSYVSKKQREELRAVTNLSDRQIKIWFQNRRMKQKKTVSRLEDPNIEAPLPANPPPGKQQLDNVELSGNGSQEMMMSMDKMMYNWPSHHPYANPYPTPLFSEHNSNHHHHHHPM